MLGTSQQRRRVEALESMAQSSARLAGAAERIASAEREKTGFFRWFFSLFGSGESRRQAGTRHYGDGGGLKDGVCPRPVAPIFPGGIGALPDARPCINVTPAKQADKTKGRSW